MDEILYYPFASDNYVLKGNGLKKHNDSLRTIRM